jgi:hypothetical protein
MNKLEELLAASKLKDILQKNGIEVKQEKKCNPVVIVLAVAGIVLAVAGIAYAVYRYFTPDYLDDFEDDFEDDDFDDDFVEDEKEAEASIEE